MADYISKKKNDKGNTALKVLIALLVLSLALMTYDYKAGNQGILYGVRNLISPVTVTLQRLGSFIKLPSSSIDDSLIKQEITEEEYEEIKDQNNELRSLLAQTEELKIENEHLTELLALRSLYELDGFAARVIVEDSDKLEKTITIDKGSNDGVKLYMPVIDTNGLIGQVITVNSNSSVVRLINDSNSGVSVMIQRTRTTGVLNGSSDGNLYLNFIPTTEEIEIGDIVVTSGLGGTYPKGIVVGEIVSVKGTEADLNYTIIVEPLTNANIDDTVLVIESLSETLDDTAVSGMGEVEDE